MNIINYTLFPTIVTEVECNLFKYIQSDLIRWIYEYQSKTESVLHSNRGGWQSPSDFYNDPSFSEFVEYIIKSANDALCHYTCEFSLGNMWININRKNDYNVCHDHPGCTISGVFWIKTPENCGKLNFRSPNSFVENSLLHCVDKEVKKDQNYYHDFEFVPKEGTMVLFASHLLHSVDQNQSDEDRISIAFNLHIIEKNIGQ
jgi:uncharacterized protein (TIGR02466 family)